MRPCYDPENPYQFFGVIGKAGPDIPWLALYHEKHRYGIGMVNLSRFSAATAGGPTQDEEAHYYFLDYSQWGTGDNFHMNFVYMCRPYVYRDTIIPKGAVYGEDSAIVAFELGEGDDSLASMKRWAELLRHGRLAVTVGGGAAQ